jgi:hypothetical protein
MNTQTCKKLVALVAAWIMSSLIVGGVGELFNIDIETQREATADAPNGAPNADAPV